MAALDFSTAVGLLFRVAGTKSTFLGTCFAFRSRSKFLTAAHCVGTLGPSDVAIGLPGVTTAGAFTVAGLETHPQADLACLTLAGGPEDAPALEPFRGFATSFAWGEDFVAFGFPEDIFGPDASQPRARFFKGYFQRYLYYRSPLGYEYNAGEMSITCPAGLSGGPVFRPATPELVSGLAAENLKSTTVLESVEEVQEDGGRKITNYQSILQYGMAVLLDSHDAWLADRAPRVLQ